MFVAILGAGGSLMDMAPKFWNYSRPIQLKSILNKQSWWFFRYFHISKIGLLRQFSRRISDKENNGLLLSYCFMLMLSSRDVLSQVIRSIRLFVERYKEISQDQSHRVASHLYGSCIPHGKKIESLSKFNIFRIYNIRNSIRRISFLSQVHIGLLWSPVCEISDINY